MQYNSVNKRPEIDKQYTHGYIHKWVWMSLKIITMKERDQKMVCTAWFHFLYISGKWKPIYSDRNGPVVTYCGDWGGIRKRIQGSFEDEGHVHCFDCGDAFLGTYIHQNTFTKSYPLFFIIIVYLQGCTSFCYITVSDPVIYIIYITLCKLILGRECICVCVYIYIYINNWVTLVYTYILLVTHKVTQ